ncbi:NFAT activation molecule 1 [Menidia menidia]
MEAQHFDHLSTMLFWAFVFLLPAACTGMEAPKIDLERRVFVAFSNEDFCINFNLTTPANRTKDLFTCFNPVNKEIYRRAIESTTVPTKPTTLSLKLMNLNMSGQYYCKYKTAKASWFLRVRAEGYKEVMMLDHTEIIMGVFTGLLLIFSVVGTVYVFRGTLRDRKIERKNNDGVQMPKREGSRDTNTEGETSAVTAAQSTSFYASLEPRPRSIYDVLEPTAHGTEPDQKKPDAQKSEPQEMVPKELKQQEESIFESIYENF